MVPNASHSALGHAESALAEFRYPLPCRAPDSLTRASGTCRVLKFASPLRKGSHCLLWCPRARGKYANRFSVLSSFPCPDFARTGFWHLSWAEICLTVPECFKLPSTVSLACGKCTCRILVSSSLPCPVSPVRTFGTRRVQKFASQIQKGYLLGMWVRGGHGPFGGCTQGGVETWNP